MSGWRLERDLFGRLMKYGGPAGAQVFLDVLVFNVFVQLVGRLGRGGHRRHHSDRSAEYGRVSAHDGDRPGGVDSGRPAARGRSARPGRAVGLHRTRRGCSVICAASPRSTCSFLACSSASFEGDHDPETFAAVARIVPTLLACVAVYSLADAVNVTFSFALRGAGDTRFVSLAYVRARVADHGGADVRDRAARRQHLRRMDIRDGLHHRHGRLLLLAVPHRQVEEHAHD